MTIERSWTAPKKPGQEKAAQEPWKEITEDRASRELANKFGDDALAKLKKDRALETQYAQYRITD